jgi:hypothetical protein
MLRRILLAAIFVLGLGGPIVSSCASHTTSSTTTETTVAKAANGEPEVITTTTTTDEPRGVLGLTFDLVETVVLFPFRVVGAVLGAIF